MSALDAAFARARGEDRALVVGYLPAGFPSLDGCVEAFETLAAAGVEVFEVGLPYSDPLMDGPVIQAAVQQSLDAGTGTSAVLETVRRVVAATGVPTVVMTYWNPVERYGAARFAADLAAAGGAGVITPDLIPEEATEWLAAAAERSLDPVFLVAPSSTDSRLALIARTNRGFVYAASTMGVTGARAAVSSDAATLVRRVRAVTDLPVAVGLGVSAGPQAAEVARYADGVIVGSALVRTLLAPEVADGADPLTALHRLAAELVEGARAARPEEGRP
ncbi:MAG TPA: tryptophan synthase subunit alpha [Mycobacteriales bacterium]|nr:tryptophan synthase subunit alpha [Mycobacteriales bacterium]